MQWAFLLEVNLKLFLEVKQANESLVVLDPILVFRLVRTKTTIPGRGGLMVHLLRLNESFTFNFSKDKMFRNLGFIDYNQVKEMLFL